VNDHFLGLLLLLLLFLQLFKAYFIALVDASLVLNFLLLHCIFYVSSFLHLHGEIFLGGVLLSKFLLHQRSMLTHGRLRGKTGADGQLRDHLLFFS